MVKNTRSDDPPQKSNTSMYAVAVIMVVFTIFNFCRDAADLRRIAILDDGWYNATMGSMSMASFSNLTGMIWSSNTPQQPASSSSTRTTTTIPLPRLVRADETNIQCPPGLQTVPIVSNLTADQGLGRKIPKIVHMTGKMKCLTSPFLSAVHQWTWEDHSFYFHDDQAVDQLFYERDWPMFPQLKNTMECLKNAGGGTIESLAFLSCLSACAIQL